MPVSENKDASWQHWSRPKQGTVKFLSELADHFERRMHHPNNHDDPSWLAHRAKNVRRKAAQRAKGLEHKLSQKRELPRSGEH
jgi:hypothetical protein